MDKSVLITLIICGSLVAISVLNFIKWNIKRKSGAAIGSAISESIRKIADDD